MNDNTNRRIPGPASQAGPQGEPGPQGPQGPAGPAGADGADSDFLGVLSSDPVSPTEGQSWILDDGATRVMKYYKGGQKFKSADFTSDVVAPSSLVYSPNPVFTDAPNPVQSPTPTINDGGEAVTYSIANGGSGSSMPGVSINSSTGVVSWPSPDAGSFSAIVTATNSAGSTQTEVNCEVAMAPMFP